MAPARRIKVTKNDLPYIDEHIRALKSDADDKLTDAIENGTPENWRVARHARNFFSKYLDKAKTVYYKRILNTDYDLWKTIENKKSSTPTEIIHQGKIITSPKKISQIMNREFYKK